MNILYIEDNAKDRMLVERYIQTTPHSLKVVSRLEEVDFDSYPVDLILLDIYFGGKISGLDYLAQIRSLGIQCPVIAVTALTLPNQMANYQRAGIDRIIAKPFEITELAEAITLYAS